MKNSAFTLLELLVVISIIAAITGLALPAISGARKKGDQVREINAARQLIIAYDLVATENNGQLMPGYAETSQAVDENGAPIPNPASCRYPWRLAPYLGFKMTGTLLVNKQEKVAQKLNHSEFVYHTSFLPSLGMNGTFVGGNYRGGLIPSPTALARYGEFVVRNRAQAVRPSMLLVFASARFTGLNETQEGHHIVDPPQLGAKTWSTDFSENDPAENTGYVHPRHSGKAVAAMLDGHVELLSFTELKDMRRWSNQAAEADQPDWNLTLQN